VRSQEIPATSCEEKALPDYSTVNQFLSQNWGGLRGFRRQAMMSGLQQAMMSGLQLPKK